MQFLCPRGHLLEAPETQTGQTGHCPVCGAAFLVPAPPAEVRVVGPGDVSAVAAPPPVVVSAPDRLPAVRAPGSSLAQVASASVPSGPVVPAHAVRENVTIPCPAGHPLETPLAMVGQPAMCPFCRAEFMLRYEDSLEYRREREDQRRLRDQRIGRVWMQWSLVIAAVVLLALGLMIAVVGSR